MSGGDHVSTASTDTSSTCPSEGPHVAGYDVLLRINGFHPLAFRELCVARVHRHSAAEINAACRGRLSLGVCEELRALGRQHCHIDHRNEPCTRCADLDICEGIDACFVCSKPVYGFGVLSAPASSPPGSPSSGDTVRATADLFACRPTWNASVEEKKDEDGNTYAGVGPSGELQRSETVAVLTQPAPHDIMQMLDEEEVTTAAPPKNPLMPVAETGWQEMAVCAPHVGNPAVSALGAAVCGVFAYAAARVVAGRVTSAACSLVGAAAGFFGFRRAAEEVVGRRAYWNQLRTQAAAARLLAGGQGADVDFVKDQSRLIDATPKRDARSGIANRALYYLDYACQLDVAYYSGRGFVQTGVVHTVRECIHPNRVTDTRLAGSRPNTLVEDRVEIVAADVYLGQSDEVNRILYCPGIVDHMNTKLLAMPQLGDRTTHAHSMCNRLTMFLIDSHLQSEVSRGSALMPLIMSTNRDIARLSMVSGTQAGMYFAPLRSLAVLGGLAGVALTVALAPRLRPAAFPMFVKQSQEAQNIILRYDAMIMAPLREEMIKSLLSYSVGRPVAASAFGLVEYAMRRDLIGLPAFALHILTGFMTFWPAVASHMAFNATVIHGHDYNTISLRTAACVSTAGLLAAWAMVHGPDVSPEVQLTFDAHTRRTIGYGYRLSDVNLPPAGDHTARVRMLPGFFDMEPRRIMQMAIGPTVAGVAPPMPDASDPPTAMHGCLSRFCQTPPKVKPTVLRALKRFVKAYVRKHFKPIPADADLSQETWLAESPYPEWRKKELREAWEECGHHVEPGDRKLKSFIKVEAYNKYKPARGINSPEDSFKVFSGPAFHRIEEEVYRNPAFIKHIPTHLRPQYIAEMFAESSGPFYETDYTQFEKHFTPEVMNSLEMVLYKHMLKNHKSIFNVIHRAMVGKNTCCFKRFLIKIRGKRMSGEMCTSLGNGFSNLMLFMYAAHRKGGRAYGIVEGDDAIFVSTVPLTVKDFEALGFEIKILTFDNILRTTFCQLTMSEDMIALVDPRKVLLKFGWTHSPMMHGGRRVQMELLRAKALSLAYEYPRCPVVCALAEAALRYTHGYTARFGNSRWEDRLVKWIDQFAERTQEQLALGPSDAARFEFAELFKVSIPEQVALETVLRGWSGGSLTHPSVLALFAEGFDDCVDYYERFCSVDALDRDF